MAELGTRTSGAISRDGTQWTGLSDDVDQALRVRHDIEQVAIETVHVGDYVLIEPDGRPASTCCVIKKVAKANDRTGRVVGWLLELTGGHHAWWLRGALVWRRRTSVPA